MTWQKKADDMQTSPRVTPRRAKSARELYRPAIKDLSQQAARAIGEIDDQAFLSSIAPGAAYQRTFETVDYLPRPDTQTTESTTQIEVMRLNTPMCSPMRRVPVVLDDNFRNQRLTYSAASRLRLLSTFQRPRSVDTYLHSPTSIPYPDVHQNQREFVVKNASCWHECSPQTVVRPVVFEREINTVVDSDKKVSCRPMIRGGTLLSDGFKGQTSGFHEHLITSHPKLKQQISVWLTNGFKIQSLRLKNMGREPRAKTPSTGRLRKFNDRKSANETLRTLSVPVGQYDTSCPEQSDVSCHLSELRILPSNPSNSATKFS